MSTNSRVGASHKILKFVPDNEILVEAALRRGQPLSTLIKPSSTSFQRIDLKKWKEAKRSATAEDPDLTLLYEVIDDIQVDLTLSANIETRILKLQQSKFNIVDKNKKPIDDAKSLFERQWFLDFIHHAITSRFEGYSLLELYEFREDGELAKCERVNKYHVKPHKGIVVKELGDDKGWGYLDGAQAPFYLPVGKATDLGLLYKAAPAILAKKYAIGHWSEFNEKMGIPFRSVHSSNMDKVRQSQLAIILENMGSAGWAVLNKDEELKLHTIAGTDPTRCFEALINILNAEQAMHLLGQSSTSNSNNNKGTYGSMEILQKISKDRHEADLTFLQYLINDILIPRLVQLSPAYRSLANLKLEWDRSEDLTVSEVVDYVVKLSSEFEVDPEFVTLKTGIPIIGRKTTTPSATLPSDKKKSLEAKIRGLYGASCCNKQALNSPAAASTPGFLKIVLKVAKAMFEGKKTGVIDRDLLKKTAEHLQEAVTSGFGFSLDDEDLSTRDLEMLKAIHKNMFVFSGVKTYQQLRAISDKLIGEDGKARQWGEFKKEVLKVHNNYNVTYLKAEFDHAIVSSQAIRQWQEIQDTKDTLPLLQFDATLDNRTTDICISLDGVTLPADDEFWDKHFLPLHWGERSVIRKLSSGKITDKKDILLPDLKPMFENNVGKTGVAFPDTHPYYDEISKADKKQIDKEVNKQLPKELK